MDCLALIHRAQEAGFILRVDAGRLVIRGLKQFADLACEIMSHKAEVIEALQPSDEVHFASWKESIGEAGEVVLSHPDHDADVELVAACNLPACLKCGSLELWQSPVGTWRCCNCEPPVKAILARQLAERIRRRYPTTPTATGDEIEAPVAPRNNADE